MTTTKKEEPTTSKRKQAADASAAPASDASADAVAAALLASGEAGESPAGAPPAATSETSDAPPAAAAPPQELPAVAKGFGLGVDPVGAGIDLAAGPDETVLQLRNASPALLDVIDALLAERERQVAKGYGPDADDQYRNHELAKASACYLAMAAGFAPARVTRDWPFPEPVRIPETRREQLIKGAALALAELEALDRATAE